MSSGQVERFKPLPRQRLGFLATREFWTLAMKTPIYIPYVLGLLLLLDLTRRLLGGLGWVELMLAVFLLHMTWGGLVERWARARYLPRLARQRAHLEAATLPATLPAKTASPPITTSATDPHCDEPAP